jgi:hypothetical protein
MAQKILIGFFWICTQLLFAQEQTKSGYFAKTGTSVYLISGIANYNFSSINQALRETNLPQIDPWHFTFGVGGGIRFGRSNLDYTCLLLNNHFQKSLEATVPSTQMGVQFSYDFIKKQHWKLTLIRGLNWTTMRATLKERQSIPNTGIGILQGRNAVSITNQAFLGDLGLQSDWLIKKNTHKSHFIRIRSGYRIDLKRQRAWESVSYSINEPITDNFSHFYLQTSFGMSYNKVGYKKHSAE